MEVGDRTALYAYCDQAVGRDELCWTSRFGNNLRAADTALESVEEFGGLRRQEVDGAQGLGRAQPVGMSLDMVQATLDRRLRLATLGSRGGCTVWSDQTAGLGVVTVTSDGPRGQVEVVQAFVIENPVFRMGRALTEAASALGPPGIGVGSRFADLEAAYPDLGVSAGTAGKVATVPALPARERLGTASDERGMTFWLGADDTVTSWAIGVPEYVENGCG